MTHLLLLNHTVKPWIAPTLPFFSLRSYWCDFSGVVCSDTLLGVDALPYQDITAIYLNGLSLYGTLPSEIGYLTKLQVLQMSNNTLYSGVPFSITTCTDLRVLDLNNNRLTGTTYNAIHSMTSLVYLNLSSNALTGGLPPSIGQMTSLIILSLGNNRLVVNNRLWTSIPSEITLLTKLRHLSLNGNKLDGSIPSNIGSLEGLTSLDLSNNRMTNTIPSQMTMLSTLMYFNISTNFLTAGRLELATYDFRSLPPQAPGASFGFCNNCFYYRSRNESICIPRPECPSISSPTPSPTPGKQNIKHDSNTKHDIWTKENFVQQVEQRSNLQTKYCQHTSQRTLLVLHHHQHRV